MVSPLQLVQEVLHREASEVVSAAETVEDSVEAFVGTEVGSAVEEEELDTKVAVGLAVEVGMVVVVAAVLVTAQHLPLMHPLVLEAEAVQALVAVFKVLQAALVVP